MIKGDRNVMEVRNPGVQFAISWTFILISEAVQHPWGSDPKLLDVIAQQLIQLFRATGDPEHVTEAIAIVRRAMQLTPGDDPYLCHLLHTLGLALQCHFEFTGALPDITEAISVGQQTLKLLPEGHAGRAEAITALGLSFAYRYERTSTLADINSAISSLSDAVRLTPVHSHNLGGMLTVLGLLLGRHFHHGYDLSDIDNSISALRGAVEHTTAEDPSLPHRLSYLGGSLACRFRFTGDLLDNAQAISLLQRVVDITLWDHPQPPEILGTLDDLSYLFRGRFQYTGELSDISEAITAARQAVNLTPQKSPHLSTRICSLGLLLDTRSISADQLSDVTEAISLHQRALKLAHDGDLGLPMIHYCLGMAFVKRFQITGNLSDINEGISSMQRAVQLSRNGSPALVYMLTGIGNAFLDRHLVTGILEDHKEYIAHYRMAAANKYGNPQFRIKATILWALDKPLQNHQSPDVISAFDAALGLLSVIGGLEKTVRGRHTQLKDVPKLTPFAAAIACSVLDQPTKALEWLEQGRCLVWKQIHQLRAPLDELRLKNPKLAQQIAEVAQQLENEGSSWDPHAGVDVASHCFLFWQESALQEEASVHANLAKQWKELLCRVRATPGFESFLQPSKCATLLQNLPESGPIVIINVFETRCDGIALLAGLDEPLHIPLPNFSENKAKEYQRSLTLQRQSRKLRMRGEGIEADSGRAMGRYGDKRGVNNAPVRTVLQGLWTDVVKPILSVLAIPKFGPLCGKDPPRIWWCPTGALSFLPLHAAGIYDPGVESESVLDYVVSSYTPTVSALTDRVGNSRPIDTAVSGLFLTSQPNAPGVPKIPGTTAEVASIHKKAIGKGNRTLKKEGNELTVDACLQYLEEYSSVHLACHGYQNPEESLRSKFYFHEGPLDLATIMRKNLRNADLAFLSACQTSTGDEELSDEAVHLAAGMLAAGYRRVVATMWSIGDSTAQEVANNFYDYLWNQREEGSGSGFDGSLSAYALHYAVQKLRDDRGDTDDAILAWAPFVHFGY